MTYSSCGQENLAEACFCANCGSALVAAADVERPRQNRTLGQRASIGLAIAIALLAVGFLASGGLPRSLLLIPIALGACLWVGVTGKWPSTQRRVNPVVRAVLGLIPVVLNGLVASVGGAIAANTCDYVCGGLGPATGAGIGLGIFVGATAVEGIAILLLVGVIKLIHHLWRRASYAHAAYEH